ncbi:MAG: hypothetical protein ACOYYS_04470 [Chloroflexota bacterium]
MWIDANVMRFLLAFFIIAMAALGLAYLSRRQLPFLGYIVCTIIILCLPAFGPFWVIAVRPGKRRAGVSPNPPRWFVWLNQKTSKEQPPLTFQPRPFFGGKWHKPKK